MADRYADQNDIDLYIRSVKDILILAAQTQKYKNGVFQSQITLYTPVLTDLHLLRTSNLTHLAEKRVFHEAEIHVQALFLRQRTGRERPSFDSSPADWAGMEWIMDLSDVFEHDSHRRSYTYTRDTDVAGVRPDRPLEIDAGEATLYARRKAKHQG